jgi:guanylate kinase
MTTRFIKFLESAFIQKAERRIFLLVGPSGAGKNTILLNLIGQVSNILQMPTATTRMPRKGEVNGLQHYFMKEEQFDLLLKEGEFAEWQIVHGKRYGTLKSVLEKGLNSDNDYIADIEVLGASSLKEIYPDRVILIFVTPSKITALEQRIKKREIIPIKEVKIRLNRSAFEFGFMDKCDYIVINDDFEEATKQLKGIIDAERSRAKLDKIRKLNKYEKHVFHFTASAIIFRNNDSEILLVERKKGERAGWWFLPGGHVEFGEYPHEAVTREVLEETGYIVTVNSSEEENDIYFDERVSAVPRPLCILLEKIGFHNHYDFIYQCECDAESMRGSSEEIAKWFEISELDYIQTPRDIGFLIRKAKTPYGKEIKKEISSYEEEAEL